MELTENENKIIKVLREAKPHEKVEIVKDSSGKYDCYRYYRSQTVVLTAH